MEHQVDSTAYPLECDSCGRSRLGMVRMYPPIDRYSWICFRCLARELRDALENIQKGHDDYINQLIRKNRHGTTT